MYGLLTSQRFIHRLFRHLVLLGFMILLFTWIAYSGREDGERFGPRFATVCINALFFFGYAYLTVYLLLPRLLLKGRLFLFVVAFLSAGIGLSVFKFMFSDDIFYLLIAPEFGTVVPPLSFAAVMMNLKDMTFIVALFALVKYARDRYVVDLNIRELKRWKLEAELELIGYQMDPHVIFNNFNSLYSISINRPELLRTSIRSLRKMLHYLFRESRHEFVPLVGEIGMIENFVALERLRFGERLSVSFDKTGKMEGHRIAPMILYSFVENAFVRGVYDTTGSSSIRIQLDVKDSRLHFRIAHTIAGDDWVCGERETGPCFSCDTSIRRLELTYPNRHRLALFERNQQHQVELNLSM